MDSFLLEATEDTPGINFDPSSNVFEISQRSLPENAIDFYSPIFEWITNYLATNPSAIELIIKLEYFNTASAKQIAKLLLLFEKNSGSTQISVKWHYKSEDKDMHASGVRFSKLIPIPFTFIEH